MPSDGSPHFNSTADCTFALNNLPGPDEPRFAIQDPMVTLVYSKDLVWLAFIVICGI